MANENRCRHFTGVQNVICEAGIRYLDVRQDNEPLFRRFPCTHIEGGSVCPHWQPYTQEEIDETEARIASVIGKLNALTSGESNECLVCGGKVSALRQVGRCVYADPCGHRQYQGSVPKAWGGAS